MINIDLYFYELRLILELKLNQKAISKKLPQIFRIFAILNLPWLQQIK